MLMAETSPCEPGRLMFNQMFHKTRKKLFCRNDFAWYRCGFEYFPSTFRPRRVRDMGRHLGSKDRRPRNVVTVKTGLYIKSPNGRALRDRSVQRLVRKMMKFMPWLQPSDYPAMRAFAELEILASTVFAELKRNGILSKDGEGRRLLNDYRALRLAQLAHQKELGMTPASRSMLAASPDKDDLASALARAVNSSDSSDATDAEVAPESTQ